MLVDYIKDYLWVIMLLILIGIRLYKSKKNNQSITWKNAIKYEPALFVLFITAIDWSRDNHSGVIADLKLTGIILFVYVIIGIVNIYRSSRRI